jgi:hypothetical protein
VGELIDRTEENTNLIPEIAVLKMEAITIVSEARIG